MELSLNHAMVGYDSVKNIILYVLCMHLILTYVFYCFWFLICNQLDRGMSRVTLTLANPKTDMVDGQNAPRYFFTKNIFWYKGLQFTVIKTSPALTLNLWN